MNTDLFKKAIADPDFGKGIVKLPEGTNVPEGKAVYFRITDKKHGAGMEQSQIVISTEDEISRGDEGKFVYTSVRHENGVDTEKKYPVSDEYAEVFDRIVRNSGMAGWNALPHEPIPGFLAPQNTVEPNHNILLKIETESKEIIEVHNSSEDICNAGGNDALFAIQGMMELCKSEPKCSIKLGTPNPVTFHEVVVPDSVELDLELRTAAKIDVLEYDETKYPDTIALEDFIRDRFYGFLVQSLKKTNNGSLMKGGHPEKYLASLLKDEIAAFGIETEVETFAFALTEDSEKRLKEALEDAKSYLNGEAVDRTDRPYSGFLDQSTFLGPLNDKSDCVPPPSFTFDPSKGSMQIGIHDKFCRNCGAKRMNDAKFCTECGNAFT